MRLLSNIQKTTPQSYNSFIKWYLDEFSIMVYGSIINLENAPDNYVYDILSIWVSQEKNIIPVKETNEEMFAIFQLLEDQ